MRRPRHALRPPWSRNQEKGQDQRCGEERVDDEEIVQAHAEVGEGLEDLCAVDGEAVDERVGEEDPPDGPGGRLPADGAPVQAREQQAPERGGGGHEHERMREAPVPAELLDRIEQGVEDDVEVRQGAEPKAPEEGFVAEFFPAVASITTAPSAAWVRESMNAKGRLAVSGQPIPRSRWAAKRRKRLKRRSR